MTKKRRIFSSFTAFEDATSKDWINLNTMIQFLSNHAYDSSNRFAGVSLLTTTKCLWMTSSVPAVAL